MGKAKSTTTEAPKVEKKIGARKDVPALVEAIGKEAWEVEASGEDKVKQYAKMFRESDATKDYDFSGTADNTLFQYINVARSTLGWTRKKTASAGGSSRSASSGEPTISDLKNARKLAEEMGMDTAKLMELVGKLTAFGSLEKLEASLKALDELMKD